MPTLERPLSPAQQDDRYLGLLPGIEADFSLGYGSTETMPYHGWPSHPFTVRSTSVQIRDDLIATGVQDVPGGFMVEAGSLGHDYLLEKYLRLALAGKPPAPSPEDYHAIEGGKVLTNHGVDRFTVSEFEDNVLGSKAGVRCNTFGKLILCFADLTGTADDFETVMKADTELLLREKELIEGHEIDPLKFGVGAFTYLLRYRYENLLVPRLLVRSPELRSRYIKMGQNLVTMAAQLTAAIGLESVQTLANQLGMLPKRLLRELCTSEDPYEDD